MSLRYALLALLTAEPLTGYDAAKRFDGSVGNVWHAPDSQIYPELRRMEQDGLVTSESVRWGPNSTKKRYAITDDGVREFRAWMGTPLDYTAERDTPHMQAAYFEWTSPSRAREHLTRHMDFHRAQAQRWTVVRQAILDATSPTVATRLAKFPADEHRRILAYKAFAYDGLIARADAEIEWARKGLELIDELERDAPAPVPGEAAACADSSTD